MKNLLLFSIISIAIMLGTMSLATTAQEPSPAGGEWVEFDGAQESSLVVANKNFLQNIEVITIEAWVYLRNKPKDGEEWIIASKPGSFALKLNTVDFPGIGKGVYLGFIIFFSESKGYSSALPFNCLNKWVHIAGTFDSQSNFMGVYLNGFVSGGGERLQKVPERLPQSEANFVVGLGLDGLIDEMRISRVRRYPTSSREFQPPAEGFKIDKDTVALWHFDEPKGETVFKDSSDNNNMLVRKMEQGKHSKRLNGRFFGQALCFCKALSFQIRK